MENKRKIDTGFLLVFALSLVFYTWLAAQTPYAWDDWTWGQALGIERFLTGSLNCRYAGNLVEIIITRSVPVKDIFMGLCFALLPVSFLAVLRQTDGEPNRPWMTLVLANILILCMPRGMWRQTYGWIAGFANYVPSALLMLLCHGLLLRKREKATPLAMLGAFALGLVSQLFLENTAIYLTAAALFFVVLRWVLDKKPDGVLIAFFIAAALGLVIMFSSSIYGELFRKGYVLDGTRAFNFPMGEGLKYKILLSMKYYLKYFIELWNRNYVLSAAILTALTLAFDKRRRVVFGVINGAFALFFCATGILGDVQLGSEQSTVYFALSVGLVYFLLVALECLLLFWKSERKRLWVLAFVWISAPAVVAPLAVTDMSGGRLFFMPYVFELEFFLLLIKPVAGKVSVRAGNALTAWCCAVLAVLCLHFVGVYRDIGAVSRERDAIFAAAQPGDTVLVPMFPHDEYIWVTDPPTVWYYKPEDLEYFKTFFSLPEDVEVIFESVIGA